MTTEHACWVPGAADPRADFPIENLPWGVAERPDRRHDAVGESLQPAAQHLVVVAAQGVARHIGPCRVVERRLH